MWWGRWCVSSQVMISPRKQRRRKPLNHMSTIKAWLLIIASTIILHPEGVTSLLWRHPLHSLLSPFLTKVIFQLIYMHSLNKILSVSFAILKLSKLFYMAILCFLFWVLLLVCLFSWFCSFLLGLAWVELGFGIFCGAKTVNSFSWLTSDTLTTNFHWRISFSVCTWAEAQCSTEQYALPTLSWRHAW